MARSSPRSLFPDASSGATPRRKRTPNAAEAPETEMPAPDPGDLEQLRAQLAEQTTKVEHLQRELAQSHQDKDKQDKLRLAAQAKVESLEKEVAALREQVQAKSAQVEEYTAAVAYWREQASKGSAPAKQPVNLPIRQPEPRNDDMPAFMLD